MKPLTRDNFSLLMTISALFLWALSILQSKLNIGDFGLISSFTPLFFVSLTLLAVASISLWTTRQSHNSLLILQTVFLILSLYLTPCILEGTARFPAAYLNFGFPEYIIRNGYINPKLIWYHCHPGFSILFASVFEISGIDHPETIMAIFPTMIMLVYLIPIYIIAKNADPKMNNDVYTVFWIFCIANWTNQEYFSAQAIALFFMLVMIALFSNKWVFGNHSISNTISLIILAAALTITHFITSIICVITMITLFSIWRFRNVNYLIIFALFIGAWTIFGSITLIQMYLPKFITQAFNADALAFAVYFFRFEATSPEHSLINYLRVIFTGIFIVIAIIGFMLQKEHERFSRENISILAIAATCILLVPIFVYSGEFIIRIWLMLLLPVAYFSTKLIHNRLTYILLTTVLLITMPVSIITRYGNEIVDYNPPSELRVSAFFFEQTKQGRVMATIPPALYKGLEKYSYSVYKSATPDPLFQNQLDFMKFKDPDFRTQYVIITEKLIHLYNFMMDRPDEIILAAKYLNDSVNYNLIYSNNGAKLYVWE